MFLLFWKIGDERNWLRIPCVVDPHGRVRRERGWGAARRELQKPTAGLKRVAVDCFPPVSSLSLGESFFSLSTGLLSGGTQWNYTAAAEERWPAASLGWPAAVSTRLEPRPPPGRPLLAVFILSNQLLKKVLTLWIRFHVDLSRLVTLGTHFSKSRKQSKQNDIFKRLLFDSSVGRRLIWLLLLLHCIQLFHSFLLNTWSKLCEIGV